MGEKGGHLVKQDGYGINQLLNGGWYYLFLLTLPSSQRLPEMLVFEGSALYPLFSLTYSLQ